MDDHSAYPSVSAFLDLDSLIDDFMLSQSKLPSLDASIVTKETPIFAQGSCFARNIAEALERAAMPVSRLALSEQANSLCSNTMLLDYLVNASKSVYAYQFETLGLYGGKHPDSRVDGQYYDQARNGIMNASAIIFTMGNSVGWFFEDGRPFIWNTNYAKNIENRYTREFSVDENIYFLKEIIRLIRSVNSSAPIFFTLSPVPVIKGLYTGSALIDDCVTKSKLRVAIANIQESGEFLNEFYWPSFEMFRWVGSHLARPVYGTADRNARHPSNQMVYLATKKFIEHVFPSVSTGPVQPHKANFFTRLRTAYHIVKG